MFTALVSASLCGDVIYAPLGIVTGVWIAILIAIFAAIAAGVILAVRARKHKKEVREYLDQRREDKNE